MVIYKRDRGFELGANLKQIQVVARAELELEPGTAGLRVRRSDHSATLSLAKKSRFSGEANLEVVNLCPFSRADLTKLYHRVRFNGF